VAKISVLHGYRHSVTRERVEETASHIGRCVWRRSEVKLGEVNRGIRDHVKSNECCPSYRWGELGIIANITT